MPQRFLPRRLALVGMGAVALALAGCGASDETPRAFTPISFDYLTPLRLNVSSVEIDDSWAPRPGLREVSNLAPTRPVDALRQMARDRLYAGGEPGRAVFVIDDASIVVDRDQYVGRFVVHLDVTAADGSRSGYAEARAQRSRPVGNTGPNATRNALGDMVSQMMADMNVEFEFQVRRSLRAYLAKPASASPVQAIQTEQLTAPAPGATPGSVSPPAGQAPATPYGAAPVPQPSLPAALGPLGTQPLSPPPGTLSLPGRPTPLTPTKLTP